MHVKDDTGAPGNVLPLRVFSSMFQEYIDNNIPKVSVLEQCNKTKLTDYNGSIITQYVIIILNCQKNDRPCFYVVKASYHCAA